MNTAAGKNLLSKVRRQRLNVSRRETCPVSLNQTFRYVCALSSTQLLPAGGGQLREADATCSQNARCLGFIDLCLEGGIRKGGVSASASLVRGVSQITGGTP
jgi:hypothetical protein